MYSITLGRPVQKLAMLLMLFLTALIVSCCPERLQRVPTLFNLVCSDNFDYPYSR